MRAGAIHVLEKPYDDNELLETIQQAMKQDKQNRAERARQAEIKARLALLTPRDREVLDLMIIGMSNKVMARHLQISEKNVEHHRANVYQKMQAESMAELIRAVLAVSEPDDDVWRQNPVGISQARGWKAS